MADAFIVRRGGGGGGMPLNSAVIHVTASTGSTISFSKGGVVVKTLGPEKAYVSAKDNTIAEWYYSVSPANYGTWTVTGTLGTDTDSYTVTIDSNEQYDVRLSVHVPVEYQKVEYLQSTGAQYLILPITSNIIKGGSIKYMITAGVNFSTLFGSSNSSSASDNVGAFGVSLYGSQGFIYNGTKTNINGQSTNIEYDLSFSVTSGSQTYINNGTTYTASTTGTPSAVRTYLFGFNYNNSVKTSELPKVRIYYCTFKDSNGDAICELIPCYHKSDSVAGMWDRVSKTFIRNSGSGSFVVGPDVN